jgi:hypothetical protein
MTQSRKTLALAALKDLAEQASNRLAVSMAWAEIPRVEVKPPDDAKLVPDVSAIIIRELSFRAEPVEFGRGRPVYELSLRAGIEIYARDQNGLPRQDALDLLMEFVDLALRANDDLGGVVDEMEIEEAPEDVFGFEGQDAIAGAQIVVVMTWNSEQRLG